MMATFIGPRNVIFGTLFCNFGTIMKLQLKVPIRSAPLWRNIANWATKRYASNSQRSQLFNASKISSQLALEALIKAHLCRKILNNFPHPENCLKRNEKRNFSMAFSNRMLSGAWKCFAISWRNIANYMMKPHATERARTQLSDA